MGKHFRPSHWHRLWHGTWTANRLMSRKFCLTVFYICGVWAIGIIMFVLYRVTAAPLIEQAIIASGVLLGIYLGVQGARDWQQERNGKHNDPEV